MRSPIKQNPERAGRSLYRLCAAFINGKPVPTHRFFGPHLQEKCDSCSQKSTQEREKSSHACVELRCLSSPELAPLYCNE